MPKFECVFLDGTKNSIAADYYRVEKDEIGEVDEYVFYRDGKVILHFPVWWVIKLEEVR